MKKLFFVALILCAVSFAQTNVTRMLSGVNAQTGTSYTFVASDVTKIVTFNNVGAVSAALPAGTTTGFGAGSVFTAVNLGVGTVTIVCSGCTINGAASAQVLQNSSVSLYGDGANYISASGSGANADNFASPPPLGNVAPNTVGATTVTVNGDGLFFQPQSNCIFEGSDPTLHEVEDVSGKLMWLYQGLGGPCTQILTYTPLPDGVNPTDKQVPAWDAASGAFTIQSQAGGSPGGSNTQIQTNNGGAFGAIANAAIGSTLASKGTSTLPAFQSKMVIDVRDYGAIPDGSTDNATAIAAAFTAANAVSAGSPTVYFGCNGAGATCKYNYSGSGTSAINPTVPMTIACAPNTFLNYTGTTHAVDIGPSGLAAADSHLYTVKDCGFTGGASYTEGIFINNFIVQVHFLNNYFLDFGNRVGATINCTGNCWLILLQSNFWFNDDNSNRNVLDAHLGTNAFVFATGNHMFCLKVTGAACDVTNPAYGIWARDAFITGNQLGPGPQPVARISSEAGGGGAGMYLLNNIIEGNTGVTTAAIEYGDPGATGNVHLANLHLVSNSIFWPSAINVDIMVTPQTPASSSYFLDASLITGNAITSSPTGTGKYFNFNLGSLNQFYGNYCGSTTVLCDQATASITETNGAKVDTWVIPYRQSNQSAGPQANYPVAMDASGPHYLSTASFHGLELPLQCSDSTGSGTAQTCNTNPKFDSTGTNLTPAAGDCIVYRTTTTNTGALTLNVNGTSAVGVQKRQGTVALAAGDLLAGHNTWLCYDGTNWDLLDPITQ